MVPFDWAVCGLVFLSVIVGFLRGFVRETLGLLSWVVAGFATVYLMPYGYQLTLKIIPHALGSLILSGSVIFLSLLILLLVVSDNIVAWTKGGMLRAIDRILGIAFGVLRGFVLLWAACWIALFLVPNLKTQSFLENSQLFPFLVEGSETLKKESEKYLILEKTLHFFKKNLEPLLNEVMASHLTSSDASQNSNKSSTVSLEKETASSSQPSLSIPAEAMTGSPQQNA